MAKDPEISLTEIDLNDVSIMIVAPTEPEAMSRWCDECRKIGVPYLYDPGMQIPRLSATELMQGILGASIVIFNEYEYEMMLSKTGLTIEEILNNVELVVKTMGDKGAVLRNKNERVHVPAAKTLKVVDPTGAGDAFRAGLLKGYFEGASLDVTGKYASISAVYAVEHMGPTEHKYTLDEFYKRYYENFGGSKK
jgi:adenosine kinase